VLVWEPRRVVPSYAVPVAELRANLTASSAEPVAVPEGILHPGIPFTAHSCPGEVVDVLVGEVRLAGAGFRPDDPDLAAYVVLDFTAFEWLEEDERLVSHAREPYHRVAVRQSSRKLRIELDGVVLAESTRPTLVAETSLPLRFYLPREDVVADLTPSELRTSCAYKGEAHYFSVGDRADLAWSYPEPLKEATELTGLIAFWDDTLDVFLDDQRREPPRTAISELILDEFGVEPPS
jgi:uncharacterized protein (DUF427 family)